MTRRPRAVERSSLFSRSAGLYDAVYAARGKDYADEAQRILRLAGRPSRDAAVLDVGCGTGQHLRAMGELGLAVGLDADAAMLAVARAKLPRAHFLRADMRRFALRRRFDLVTCLFAAVGYLPDEDGVLQAVGSMARCLAPDGLLLLELPLAPERLAPPRAATLSLEHEGCRVERRATAEHEAGRLRIRFDYALERAGRTERFTETHALLALPEEVYQRAFERSGLTAERDETWPSLGGLLIGRRA